MLRGPVGAWVVVVAIAACGGQADPGSGAEIDLAEPDAGDDARADVEPTSSDADDAHDTEDAPEDTGDPTGIETQEDVRDETADVEVDDAPDDSAEDTDGLDADALDDTPDVVDADALDITPDAGCLEGDPCVWVGYLPPCYQARCNAHAACVAERVSGCCVDDDDCAPPEDGVCTSVHCLQQICTDVPIPGCCQSGQDAACDDGDALTADACTSPAARCAHCPPPCESRPALLSASFDDPASTPAAAGFVVYDPQPADAVTWQRTDRHFAAGGGALYLGDPRCHTYYGGALTADCTPRDPSEQDSTRILVGLYTPVVSLPSAGPAVLVAWVRAAVEPLGHLGLAEPDILRILVEPLGAPSPIWPVGSTLDLGKSTDWTPIAVDLSPWRGQVVRVRFEFDTLDGQSNRYEGVWLDEIVIRETCAGGGCCDDDGDCGAPGACTRPACLLTSQGGARVCADVAATPDALCRPCDDDAACADDDPCTHDTCLSAGSCDHETFCCLERDVYAETFDTSLGALTVGDPDPLDGVGWRHVPGAAWFGDPLTGDYSGPARVSGTLTSPPVALPAALAPGQSAVLALALRLSTEWDAHDTGGALEPLENPGGLDRLSVEVLDGDFTTELWSSDRIGGSTGGEPHLLALDLTPWLGRSVRVQIGFDSGDETLNAFAGPFIDALAVAIRCSE